MKGHPSPTRGAPVLFTALAVLATGCPPPAGGDNAADVPAADGDDAADVPAADGDDAADVPAADGDSDAPWGWVNPRCGDDMVGRCADCPGRPYVCDACELSANCVVDCDSGCGGRVNCPGSGACTESGVECTTEISCGCAPPLKDCDQGAIVTCVANCTADCPGLPKNEDGSCSDWPEALGGCPDGDGPEYFCKRTAPDGTGTCASSCEACGPTYCLVGSCSGSMCNPGFLPDYPYYTCDRQFCCPDGFLCPATSECVASCGECPGAAAGACGEHGVCVGVCDECLTGPPAERDIEVCDGRCVDLFTDLSHCAACGAPCTPGPVGMERAQCARGHCCQGSSGFLQPWEWCDLCNCCLGRGTPCNAANCATGCVG